MSNFILTEDQSKCLTVLQQSMDNLKEIFSHTGTGNFCKVVDGKAGVGKTTIVPNIVSMRNDILSACFLLAPTNKAVGVLKSKFSDALPDSVVFKTLHSCIYGQANDEDEWVFKDEYIYNALVIIDEASMVTQQVYLDLLKKFKKSFIIFIGDSYQLEAIGEPSPIYKNPENIIHINQVCRHDNGILTTANLLRDNKYSVVNLNKDVTKANDKTLQEICSNFSLGIDSVLITSTNKSRIKYNQTFRKVLRKPNTICNDLLISISNSNIYSNGDLFTLENPILKSHKILNLKGVMVSAQIYTIGKGVLIHLPDIAQASMPLKQLWESMSISDYVNMCGRDNVHVPTGFTKNVVVSTYAYALSCHKCQGSSFKHVYVDFDYCASTWDASRWLYTAVTRASESVTVMSGPNVMFL